MKIRITANQLRFRLSDVEVKNLGLGKSLFLDVHLGSGSQQMHYKIISDTDSKSISVFHLEGSLSITIPEEHARVWSGNDEEGIYTSLKTEIGTTLNVAIEKDYPCKH